MNRRATTFIRQLGQVVTPPAGGYGRLYNWFAASNANFAPTDWKTPTDAEWTTLTDYLGGLSVAGGHLKESGETHWSSPNEGADNSSGFTALPTGYREYNTGLFYGFLEGTQYHTNTASDATFSWYRELSSLTTIVTRDTYYKKAGFAVRLLYTGAGTPTTMTDYDGNVYDVVQIGTQYWTKQNWKCTKLNNGTSIPEETNASNWAALTTGAWCYYDNDSGNL